MKSMFQFSSIQMINPTFKLIFTLRIKNIWHLTSKYLLFIFFTDDDLIRDFLWMDCCCKMTDKVNWLVNVLMKVTQSL